MKKAIIFPLTVFLSFLCLGCPNVDCKIEGHGEVYLTILDENGVPFPDSEAERFRVAHSSLGSGKRLTIINERDELIFSLGTIKIGYNSCKRLKKKEGFTDNEILDALNDKFVFSIKDIKDTPVYKTIENKSYKTCFVRFERTNIHPATYTSNENPTHIYYCEVKLEKR